MVNALSKRLEVEVKRDGQLHQIAFAHGACTKPLTIEKKIARKQTGTRVRFWPDASFFDSDKFSVPRLKHLLLPKQVLCSGLKIDFFDEHTGERESWCYENGLPDYLVSTR